ncbi:DUF3892 domain-containing protein [Carnobacterium maltaromaticum]|uniref:DUF3892 domain-containing protein n=1 Tax=Carnobacterium maltaromaticum TaxID=2751 RepID=UPI00026C8EFF|nr:DUF3892 domain-containing protein [Carnobacterium maltaromaticum]MBC9787190.1 DUF3892 domain-containing protein [Carnobacterium maltaromaticum]
MPYQITHIRLSDANATGSEKITAVKLSDNSAEYVSDVVKRIDLGLEYYYTTATYSRANVETVHPSFGNPYIRTKANKTERDNLLSLPRF